LALGQRISDDSITLVRNNGKVLPLKAEKPSAPQLPYQASEPVRNRVVLVIFSDDVRLESGRVLEHEFRSRIPDARIFYVDPKIAGAMSAEILKATGEAGKVVAAIYAVPLPGVRTRTDETLLADQTGILLKGILDRDGQKTMVVAVGNPFLAKDFPNIENYLCTFSTASVSEISAVKAIFAEIPIRGHLPITIPNIAKRGEAIDRRGSME
jgi:beta-N-acetylhexosaminidase